MNPVFNKPLNNQEQQKNNDELTSELLSQFVDMVFNEVMEEENNDLKNQNIHNTIPKDNTSKDTTQEQKTYQKMEQFYAPSTATLDFVNNCIFVNNNKYYIERYVGNNDIVINRLVALENVYNIEQFADKFVNKNLYNYKILSNDLLIYFNKERKFALKLIDKNGKEHEIDIEHPSEIKTYKVVADEFLMSAGADFSVLATEEEYLECYEFDKDYLVCEYLKKHPKPLVINHYGRIEFDTECEDD